MKTRLVSYGLLAAAVAAAAGCAAPNLSLPSASSPASRAGSATGGQAEAPKNAPTSSASSAPTAAKPATGPISNNAGGLISNNSGPATGSAEARDAAGPGGMPPMAPAPAATSAPVSGKGGDEFAGGAPVQVDETPLKAGAVDDNAKFKDYLTYRKEFDGGDGLQQVRNLDISRRNVLRVVDANGKGVANADVVVKAGEVVIAEARTYADGRTLFHPSAYKGLEQTASFAVTATKGEQSVTKTFEAATQDWSIALGAAIEKPAAKLDMAIVLDTTGSMGGEIAKFQATIATIATRIRDLPQQPAVRFGLVGYKDQGEQYVTRVTGFTSEVGTFQTALNQLSASGGGDKPEDMEAALADTVNKLQWDGGDSVRLSFVVSDASAHTDYPQSTPYTDTMQVAAKKGIKLYAIGASGLEPEGEYMMRQFAQWTMGQYLFVTRGGDEATGGGGTASANVDKFREGRLDDIVVDIVKAELEKLGQ